MTTMVTVHTGDTVVVRSRSQGFTNSQVVSEVNGLASCVSESPFIVLNSCSTMVLRE